MSERDKAAFRQLARVMELARRSPADGSRARVLYRSLDTGRWYLAGHGSFTDRDVASFLERGTVRRISGSGDVELAPLTQIKPA